MAAYDTSNPDHADSAVPSIGHSRIDVIINQRSGASETGAVGTRVSKYLTSRGVSSRVAEVRTGSELTAAIARAAAGDADVVLACGGDGTVAAVAAALVGTSKVLGVLPLGTFNYFARRIGVPLDINEALDVLAAGHLSQVSVGDVNGRVFLNNASIGLYPTVLRKRERTYRQIGRSRVASYLSVALALARRPAFLNLRLDADGHPLSRRTPLLFIGANAQQMASFSIPGDECLQSNRFAVYIARPLGVIHLWRLALRAFFRGLYGAHELEVICARELKVQMRRPTRISVAMDGEVVVLAAPLRFQLRVDSLRVISGPAAGHEGSENVTA